MAKQMKKIIPLLVLSTLLFVPVLVLGQKDAPPLAMSTFAELEATIKRLGGWIWSILIVVTVVVVVWGAAELVFSSGEPQKVESGKNKILYGIIGFVVAGLARGMVEIVKSFFGIY